MQRESESWSACDQPVREENGYFRKLVPTSVCRWKPVSDKWNESHWVALFLASRGPFSFVFAELTGGTKRDLCHGSKWTVLSMRHGYLATETSRDTFSTWSADDSHLSQLERQKHLHSFVVVNGEFTKTLKKVDSSSRDSCCLIYSINFKLSGQGSFLNMTTTPGIKENLTHWRLRVLWSLHLISSW